jgi:5'-nucleotidase
MTYRQDMYRRGCVIDRKRGNILKLDRHRYVRYAEHGLTEISATERKQLYTQNHKGIQDMTSSNYANTDTPFSLG